MNQMKINRDGDDLLLSDSKYEKRTHKKGSVMIGVCWD